MRAAAERLEVVLLMHPGWILLFGVIIVIGGVLGLRLHAFLALVLAALVVGGLTPPAAVERYGLQKEAVKLAPTDSLAGEVLLLPVSRRQASVGMHYLVLRAHRQRQQVEQVGRLEVVAVEQRSDQQGKQQQQAVARLVEGDPDQVRWDTDLVVHPHQWQSAQALANQSVGERVATAFGNTCANIGILIAMAAIIGKCLLDSGAADRVIRSALKLVGERGAPKAFIGSGFLLGIPVFFDTVFYLMMPLGKALRMRTGRNYLLYVLTIVAGATMAHSLVPPTPGPLFVAEALGVDLGLMILAGCGVGLITSSLGYGFALWANRRWEVPLRESPDFRLADLEELAQRDQRQLPPLSLALLPILLPVVLIAGSTVLHSAQLPLPTRWVAVADTLGNKNIALVLAAAVALALLVWQKRTHLKDLAAAVQGALASGGVIILITAAGGAFGSMLQQTGVAGLIGGLPQGSSLLTLAMAFLITTAIRTAQGSATVAMITAVGVLAGMAEHLACHPVYLALAIGCGSKPLAWMNDSGFWVICKMSGMTEAEGLRSITPMSAIMGLGGLLTILAAATLWPLR